MYLPRDRCADTCAVLCRASHQDLLLSLVEPHASHHASAHNLTSLLSVQACASCLKLRCCCELGSPEGLLCAVLCQLRERLGLVLRCEDRLDRDAVVLGLPQRAAPVPVRLAALRDLPPRACASHDGDVGASAKQKGDLSVEDLKSREPIIDRLSQHVECCHVHRASQKSLLLQC